VESDDEIWAIAKSDGGIKTPSSSGKASTCGPWHEAATADFAEGGTTFRVINGINYELYLRSCPADGTGTTQYAWVPLARSGRDVATLALDLVKRRLPAPVARFAPAPDRNVTQVGTWFWTEPQSWRPVSATASVPGLSATVTATPTRLRFSPGDGTYGTGDVSCTGPGTPFKAEYGDDMASACMYTYHHSSSLSATGTWAAALSIDWTVTFSATDGSRGNLGQLTTTTRRSIRVEEIEAVLVEP